jgi:hypothetical protein
MSLPNAVSSKQFGFRLSRKSNTVIYEDCMKKIGAAGPVPVGLEAG